MFRLFSRVYSALIPTDHSTMPMAYFPGGPSPQSAAFPSHNSKPIDTRHPTAASVVVETETLYQGGEIASSQRQELADPQPTTTRDSELTSPSDDLPHQPSAVHPATDTSSPSHPHSGHPLSDEHPESASSVRVAAPEGRATEGSLGKEGRRSASVASRRTNRSLRNNHVGEYASATAAAAAANEPPDVDSGLQPRAASLHEEHKLMAAIGKEERAFSQPTPAVAPSISSVYKNEVLIDTVGWTAHRRRRPKAIEKNRKARGQGRESHSARRAQRASRDPGAANGFHQGNFFFPPYSASLRHITCFLLPLFLTC
jgi:hypothetical protein